MIVIISTLCSNRVTSSRTCKSLMGTCVLRMALLHTHATVFRSSGGVTSQLFPPVCEFGILSDVSHPKPYTVIVGGSKSSKAFHIMGCMKVCVSDVLVCYRIGWRQLDFSWAYPITGRDSKESEHIQIIVWDRR